MIENLKNCPFCGGSAVLQNGREGYYVECTQCFTRSTVSDYRYTSIAQWNLRRTERELNKMIEDLRATLKAWKEEDDD